MNMNLDLQKKKNWKIYKKNKNKYQMELMANKT